MNWKYLPHGCSKGGGETTKLKLEGKVFVLFGKHYKARCYTQFPQGWLGWERTSHCDPAYITLMHGNLLGGKR